MILKNKKIGVWGYGLVGKSVATFAHRHGALVSIMDKLPINKSSFHYYSEADKLLFFEQHDYIVPSPGIDITQDVPKIGKKLLTELDLFSYFFHKPIIAITGSVGKTTITTLLASILNNYGIRAVTGGNIGTPCLNLIAQQNNIDYAVLEVSSFQLEYCRSFAPDLAIITNFTPNHLDRHTTMASYRTAKLNILKYQNCKQKGLVPRFLRKDLPPTHGTISFFAETAMPTTALPPITFTANWVIIEKAVQLLGCNITQLPNATQSLHTPEHRLEHIATIQGVDYYNDSKATTPVSTCAAVNQLRQRPIHLLLGGLSKGLNRESLVAQLKNNVKTIICFGAEAPQLYAWCTHYKIPATQHKTLEDAFEKCARNAHENDIVLLAPSGSSFDLFANFQERGNRFKSLTRELQKQYDTGKRESLCIRHKNDSTPI